METQETIYAWFKETFPRASLPSQVMKIQEEAGELLSEFAEPGRMDKESVANEIADIMIVVMNLASILDIDAAGAVDAKMNINRARRWGENRHIA